MHSMKAVSDCFYSPLWKHAAQAVLCVCVMDPSCLAQHLVDVFLDSNRLYLSVVHLSLHPGECVWCPCRRVVHVSRRPWAGQQRLQWLWPQCHDEKDGRPAACEFAFILEACPFSTHWSIYLFTSCGRCPDCEPADENEAAAPLPRSRDEDE